MYMKMVLSDMKENRVINLSIFIFILAASLCLSLASVLTINLFSVVDHMLLKAKVPHFLQMHAGVLDKDRLYRFASTNELVSDMQVLEFLNIEGQAIEMGEKNIESSIQANGLSTQSKSFDFLLDLDGHIIHVNEGEIYAPLIYYKEGLVSVGDTITIFGHTFVMKGFLRDAQMNSSLSSSKRFLVHEEDYR